MLKLQDLGKFGKGLKSPGMLWGHWCSFTTRAERRSEGLGWGREEDQEHCLQDPDLSRPGE